MKANAGHAGMPANLTLVVRTAAEFVSKQCWSIQPEAGSRVCVVSNQGDNNMQLLLRRDQKSGIMGGIKFNLNVQAQLTPEEKAYVKKYGMSNTLLYQSPGGESKGLIGTLLQLNITVSDLIDGKTIECKSILEILGAQEQLKEASRCFHQMLMAAAKFEGEEVLTFQ